MFIVITGLDGSGTSTIAEKLHEIDKKSILVRTPSVEFSNREKVDEIVREISPMSHYLYYLSSVVYMSDYIRRNIDYKENNVYCVRYLVDTVVSHQVAGLDVELDYESYGIIKPDLTIFIGLNENLRQERISKRGKSILDKVLDNNEKRKEFFKGFEKNLSKNETIYFDNGDGNITEKVKQLFEEINRRKWEWSLKIFYCQMNKK